MQPFIIQRMKVQQYHSWQVNVSQAKEIQKSLASRLSLKNEISRPRFVAGADISHPDSKGVARGAVVVLTYPELHIIEVQIAEGKPIFPYVPGLLSFRESPLILAACEKLTTTPDLIFVDGQGIAHPRRFGLASHLGLLLDTPSIGCAKSLLLGKHEPVDYQAGSHKEVFDGSEVIGVALRTKAGMSPIYVSIGHKVDLPAAIYWVKQCCQNHRLPEPIRLAHLAAGGKIALQPDKQVQYTQQSLFN